MPDICIPRETIERIKDVLDTHPDVDDMSTEAWLMYQSLDVLLHPEKAGFPPRHVDEKPKH